jgi:hypothetical protein
LNQRARRKERRKDGYTEGKKGVGNSQKIIKKTARIKGK